jgi:hypothetical protein
MGQGGCAGEVTRRGDGGAECSADLALDGVELGVTEEAELEENVFSDEESPNDVESSGLYERGGGEGIDEGCSAQLSLRAR